MSLINWVACNEAITPEAWRGNNWTMVSSILWYQPPALSGIRIVQNDSQPTTSNQDLRAAADLRGVLFRQHLWPPSASENLDRKTTDTRASEGMCGERRRPEITSIRGGSSKSQRVCL